MSDIYHDCVLTAYIEIDLRYIELRKTRKVLSENSFIYQENNRLKVFYQIVTHEQINDIKNFKPFNYEKELEEIIKYIGWK